MSANLKDILFAELDKLPDSRLAEVLAFVRRNDSILPPGTPPGMLKEFIGSISRTDLDIMEKVIEEDCRQVDYENW